MKMILIRLELLVLVTVWFVPSVNCADECTQVSGLPPCVCETSDGKRVDLRSLANKEGKPAFKDIKGEKADMYSYNPCYNFTQDSCNNVAGCQNSDGTRSIGEQSKAVFKNDGSETSIHYSGGKNERKMIVKLQCTEGLTTAEFKFLSESNIQEYTFLLNTECACPGTCGSGGGGGGGGSHDSHHHSSISRIGIPGVLVLSIFVILITVYCVAGMIVMRVKYEKTGTDIIPNKTLWFGLPSLVKDGCIFTFTPCINFCRNRRGYSKV